MNEAVIPSNAEGACQLIHLPEFGITWAGANPFDEGFCFGSETGAIAFTDIMGKPVSAIPQASAQGEAINGVAFSQNWLAVTTRKDINFIGPFPPKIQPAEMVVVPGGGRDVSVAPTSGHFVIPLGPDGIMFVKPNSSGKVAATTSRSEYRHLNFCRAVALSGERESDVVVCAGRRGGVGYAEYREGISGHLLHTVAFNELDFVDVCSLATPDKPLALAAAAKDGSLVLFADILADKNPQIMKFKGIKGTAYRVLSAQGDIYLLTSKGLFGLCQLAAKFTHGETLHHQFTDIHGLALEASDANIVGKRWLMATGADDVFRIDTEKMARPPQNGASNTRREEPAEVKPLARWEESSFELSEYLVSI